MSENKLEYKYCLSTNDESIIKHHTDKPLSSNAEKTLIILSNVFGGLHHLDSDQLDLFDYQSDFYNEYLHHGSLSTFDGEQLTLLVIMAHDMAVRFEIQASRLDPDDEHFDKKLLEEKLREAKEDYGYDVSLEEFAKETTPYLRFLFHERQREGDFSRRHPTLESTMNGFRKLRSE